MDMLKYLRLMVLRFKQLNFPHLSLIFIIFSPCMITPATQNNYSLKAANLPYFLTCQKWLKTLSTYWENGYNQVHNIIT